MNSRRRQLLATIAIGLLSCAGIATAQQPTPAQIVAGLDRTDADRTTDLRRKPEQMLAFIAARPGSVVLDLSAGGGYTTELLARSIGPTGTVHAMSRPRPAQPAAPPAAPEGNPNPSATPQAALAVPAVPRAPPRPSPVVLAERDARLKAAGVAAAPIVAVVRPFEDPLPPELAAGRVDLATLIFNYHDLGHMGVDRAAMNRAVFAALKPGGFYVIADHAGRPGTGISEAGTLHRVEEAFLRAEVEAAGLKLVASGDFLRNPNDPRDENTPDPPQPKDQFVLKFVKP